MSSPAWAEDLIAGVARARPDVVRLAEWASLAVQVDAPLLRRLRRALLPDSDPGLEADVWFSPLLEVQDEEAGAFHEAVLLRLRERLGDRLRESGSPPFNRIARQVRAAHAHLPAAARMEENLTALAVRHGPQDSARMERELEPALRALSGGDEAHALEVARWAMQAAGRLPEPVRKLPHMQVLLLGAALRLEQPSLVGAAGEPALSDETLAWLLPSDRAAERTTLGVALLATGLRFEAADQTELTFELPRTNPLLVSVRWQAEGEHRRLVRAAPGVVVEIPGGVEAVEIVTLAGEAYTLARTAALPADLGTVPPATQDPDEVLRDMRLEESMRQVLERSLVPFGITLREDIARDAYNGRKRRHTLAEGRDLQVSLIQVPGWMITDPTNLVSFEVIRSAFEGRTVRIVAPHLDTVPPGFDRLLREWGERWRFVPWRGLQDLAQGMARVDRVLGLDLPQTRDEVPAAVRDGCVLLEDLGSTMTPAVAFAVGDGRWVTSAHAFPQVPFLGTVGGEQGDQFQVLNAGDESSEVRVLRPLQEQRLSATVPLAPAESRRRKRPWRILAFVDGYHQVVPARLPTESDPRANTFVIETSVTANDLGAPVLEGNRVVGMVLRAIDRTTEASFRLEVLSTELLRAAVDRALKLRVTTARPPIPNAEMTPPGAVTAVRYVGQHLLVACGDGSLRLYDADSAAISIDLQAHGDAIKALALNPKQGQWSAATGSRDGTVKLWDLAGDDPVREFELRSPVQALAATPDGRLLAGTADGRVTLLPQNTPLMGEHEGLRALAVVPPGERVVSAGWDGRLALWDLKQGRQLRRLSQEGAPMPGLLAVAVLPDGRTAVSGSVDGALRLWNLQSHEAPSVTGHQGAVRALAVTRGGSRVVSGSRDGTIRIWEAATSGEPPITLSMEGAVLTVALSNDDRLLVAGSEQGWVSIWDLKQQGQIVGRFPSGPARVFVSYAAADQTLAVEIARVLGQRGLSTYIDRSDYVPGQPLRRSIVRAIERCELLLALVTPTATKDGWLDPEVERALAAKKRLFSVLVGGPDGKPETAPPMLASAPTFVLESDRRTESLMNLSATVEAFLEGAVYGPAQANAVPPRRQAPPSRGVSKRPAKKAAARKAPRKPTRKKR